MAIEALVHFTSSFVEKPILQIENILTFECQNLQKYSQEDNLSQIETSLETSHGHDS